MTAGHIYARTSICDMCMWYYYKETCKNQKNMCYIWFHAKLLIKWLFPQKIDWFVWRDWFINGYSKNQQIGRIFQPYFLSLKLDRKIEEWFVAAVTKTKSKNGKDWDGKVFRLKKVQNICISIATGTHHQEMLSCYTTLICSVIVIGIYDKKQNSYCGHILLVQRYELFF